MSNDDHARKNLDDASLAGSNLADADLSHASLRRTRLSGANLQGASLAGADLHGAQLDGADVTGADLRNADLTGASLHGVDLDRAASTEGAQLTGARGLGDGMAANARDDQTAGLHLDQAADDIVLLTQDIAAVARAARDEAEMAGGSDAAERRHVTAARIAELQARRNLVEDRILSLLEDLTDAHPAADEPHP